MDARDVILRGVDALERVQANLAAVATRSDDARRHDLIAFRRQLSTQIAAIGRVAEPVFANTGDADLVRAYRATFSNMRAAAALHQANWPAVRLGESPTEYRASAVKVRAANRAFITWIRAAVAGLPAQR